MKSSKYIPTRLEKKMSNTIELEEFPYVGLDVSIVEGNEVGESVSDIIALNLEKITRPTANTINSRPNNGKSANFSFYGTFNKCCFLWIFVENL